MYFTSVSSSGSGAGLVWTLQLARKDETMDMPLAYSFEVHVNGMVLSAKNGTHSLRLTHFYRPLCLKYASNAHAAGTRFFPGQCALSAPL